VSGAPRTVLLHVDGGARGNPGPAAIGVVIQDADGTLIEEVAETIGVATNNVAEYRSLLRGLQLAAELNATAVRIFNDSELVARQLTGDYRVKNEALKPLHAQAKMALEAFEHWEIHSVPRERNARADGLVNRALDGR
jgi:ribonuclease HI